MLELKVGTIENFFCKGWAAASSGKREVSGSGVSDGIQCPGAEQELQWPGSQGSTGTHGAPPVM